MPWPSYNFRTVINIICIGAADPVDSIGARSIRGFVGQFELNSGVLVYLSEFRNYINAVGVEFSKVLIEDLHCPENLCVAYIFRPLVMHYMEYHRDGENFRVVISFLHEGLDFLPVILLNFKNFWMLFYE